MSSKTAISNLISGEYSDFIITIGSAMRKVHLAYLADVGAIAAAARWDPPAKTFAADEFTPAELDLFLFIAYTESAPERVWNAPSGQLDTQFGKVETSVGDKSRCELDIQQLRGLMRIADFLGAGDIIMETIRKIRIVSNIDLYQTAQLAAEFTSAAEYLLTDLMHLEAPDDISERFLTDKPYPPPACWPLEYITVMAEQIVSDSSLIDKIDRSKRTKMAARWADFLCRGFIHPASADIRRAALDEWYRLHDGGISFSEADRAANSILDDGPRSAINSSENLGYFRRFMVAVSKRLSKKNIWQMADFAERNWPAEKWLAIVLKNLCLRF